MLYITPKRSELIYDWDLNLAEDKGIIFIQNWHQNARTPQSPIMPLLVKAWPSNTAISSANMKPSLNKPDNEIL